MGDKAAQPSSEQSEQPDKDCDTLKFEEYKLIVENTQKMSERRQSATRTYLSVNTAIFVVLGFLIKEGKFEGWLLLVASFPLFISGFIASFTWLRIIRRFREFIDWRYLQIVELETNLAGCYRLFTKEGKNESLFGDKKTCFSARESWLPIIFMSLYGVYAAGLLAYNVIEWCKG
ncbi:MAG: hypothetical protein ABIJ61_03215 [bacterium]